MTIEKELKEAISRLPSDEKDKLIFRLLKKDLNLANKLLFELVSGGSKEDRREEIKKKLEDRAKAIRMPFFSSPGKLLMEMKHASGIINEHVNVTKDKYGEVSLQIFVLKEFLKVYNENFKDCPVQKSYTFNAYLVAKTFKVMVLFKKLHEDLQFDFVDDLDEIGCLFGDNPCLMKAAIYNGLDVNWLRRNRIPNNIAEIEKDIRECGLLK